MIIFICIFFILTNTLAANMTVIDNRFFMKTAQQEYIEYRARCINYTLT